MRVFGAQFAGCIIKSRAEPSRAEPSRAEPSRAEPSRAEPSRAEPSRAEPMIAPRVRSSVSSRPPGSQSSPVTSGGARRPEPSPTPSCGTRPSGTSSTLDFPTGSAGRSRHRSAGCRGLPGRSLYAETVRAVANSMRFATLQHVPGCVHAAPAGNGVAQRNKHTIGAQRSGPGKSQPLRRMFRDFCRTRLDARVFSDGGVGATHSRDLQANDPAVPAGGVAQFPFTREIATDVSARGMRQRLWRSLPRTRKGVH